MKNGKKFSDYNIRSYILRVVKDDFRKNKNETDAQKIQQLYDKGKFLNIFKLTCNTSRCKKFGTYKATIINLFNVCKETFNYGKH